MFKNHGKIHDCMSGPDVLTFHLFLLLIVQNGFIRKYNYKPTSTKHLILTTPKAIVYKYESSIIIYICKKKTHKHTYF